MKTEENKLNAEDEKREQLSFSLTREQCAGVQRALEKAKAMAGGDDPGVLLDLICNDFSATNAGNMSVDDYLKRVERITGTEIISYDPELDEILYGADTVERLCLEVDEVEAALSEAPADRH